MYGVVCDKLNGIEWETDVYVCMVYDVHICVEMDDRSMKVSQYEHMSMWCDKHNVYVYVYEWTWEYDNGHMKAWIMCLKWVVTVVNEDIWYMHMKVCNMFMGVNDYVKLYMMNDEMIYVML